MVELYYILIKKGKRTLESVPEKLRADVEKLIKERDGGGSKEATVA